MDLVVADRETGGPIYCSCGKHFFSEVTRRMIDGCRLLL